MRSIKSRIRTDCSNPLKQCNREIADTCWFNADYEFIYRQKLDDNFSRWANIFPMSFRMQLATSACRMPLTSYFLSTIHALRDRWGITFEKKMSWRILIEDRNYKRRRDISFWRENANICIYWIAEMHENPARILKRYIFDTSSLPLGVLPREELIRL